MSSGDIQDGSQLCVLRRSIRLHAETLLVNRVISLTRPGRNSES